MVILLTLAAAYGAHYFGLVDLSGYAAKAKDAYTFTASRLPAPVKQGIKYGVVISSTLTTASVVLKVAKHFELIGGLSGHVAFPSFHFDGGRLFFDADSTRRAHGQPIRHFR